MYTIKVYFIFYHRQLTVCVCVFLCMFVYMCFHVRERLIVAYFIKYECMYVCMYVYRKAGQCRLDFLITATQRS